MMSRMRGNAVLETTTTVNLQHEGRSRAYLLHAAPPRPPDPAPLLIELHGRGIDAGRFDRMTGFKSLADEKGFVLAMPSGVDGIWNSRPLPTDVDRPDDVAYLLALIDDVCDRVSIDRQRIYVVGMSNGAGMAGRLACLHPERLTAFAQVAGTGPDDLATRARPTTPVPILQIHGTADRIVPYRGGSRRRPLMRLLGHRALGASVGIDDWARFWTEANHTGDEPEVSRLPPDTTIRVWRGPSGRADVVFYRINGGGHTWPSSRVRLPRVMLGRTSETFDATRIIWDFLASHSR
jgi:polyhydroxybutyrate depolymerase